MNASNVKEKSWEEFRETGLLWMINAVLHLFGWAIVYQMEDGEAKKVYPARVAYRGFDEKSNTEGYARVSGYLKENIEELSEEAQQ